MSEQVPSILCHPDGKKSCGACCGMYNHVDHDEAVTLQRLRQRTRAFFDEARVDDPESLKAFRKKWEDGEAVKLLTGLASCPFLGFVGFDPEGSAEPAGRVGCLVHPLQNEGVDGRDCGVYDRHICEDYLCAAHDVLRRDEIRLVLDAVDDSYLYGLVITNPRFIRKMLELAAEGAGRWPSAGTLRDPAVIRAAATCIEELRQWPYRSADGIFGQVEVAGSLDTRRRRLPSESLGVDSSPVDILLVCMGTTCESEGDLVEARRRMEAHIDGLAKAIEDHHRS